MEQPALAPKATLAAMPNPHIVRVEQDGAEGLLVTFSDGTIAGYVVEELLELRPYRELVKEPAESNPANTHKSDTES